jgi:penicillin-binding protein 2
MFSSWKRRFNKRKKSVEEIYPDEIFLDSENLPDFDVHQFEGRIEKPISLTTIVSLSIVFLLFLVVIVGRAWLLQGEDGAVYAAKSEANRLRETVLFAERGAIYDRSGEKLAWNKLSEGADDSFSIRVYTKDPGFSHVLGYVKYPAKDKYGVYYRTDFQAVDGVEKYFDSTLSGTHGIKITETDALGVTQSESTVRQSANGENLTLSIDARLQKKLFEAIQSLARRVGFTGGGGVLMDVHTGEILALTSFPEYDSAVMAAGTDAKKISGYFEDTKKPFLDRVTQGLYTPGSIVKPYVALGALEEKIITPEKEILSTGSISVQNPYDPEKKTLFNDWKAHGLVDMQHAIAVSSNVYFYEIGGGYGDQVGLGINRIVKYLSLFNLGSSPEAGFFAGPDGTIPSPEWKDRVFPGDPWRIGDTYYTAIGQYGFQVTPLQMLRAVSALANGGILIHPTILSIASSSVPMPPGESLPISESNLKIVRGGMRLGAQIGSASGLNLPYVEVAAKTGTAELGVSKQFVNSWVTGFFPYDNPRYAFTVIMERGPRANVYGATYVMRELLDWMHQSTPEYLKIRDN